jgi:hypothetical protein
MNEELITAALAEYEQMTDEQKTRWKAAVNRVLTKQSVTKYNDERTEALSRISAKESPNKPEGET